MIGQHDRRLYGKWMSHVHFAKSAAEQFNVFSQQAQSAVGQIDREEIAAAGDKISPIAGHQGIVLLRRKRMGFARAQPILRRLVGVSQEYDNRTAFENIRGERRWIAVVPSQGRRQGQRPAGDERAALEHKFHSLAVPFLGEAGAADVLAVVDRLEQPLDLQNFTGALRDARSGTRLINRPVEILALLGQGRGVARKGLQ
jgi:hypothetical protein